MASTLTTYDFALKEWLTDDRVENLVFQDRPFLGNVKKETEFQGSGHPVPVIYRAPQGIAVSLSDAQTYTSNVAGAQFLVTAGDLSGTVDIGDKVIRASRSNAGAFLQNKKAEVEGLHGMMADALAISLVGNGGGSVGRRGSLSSNTITLLDKSDVHKFHVGMPLKASANDGSDTSHALRAGTVATVTAIDLAAGTVTVDNAANITSFADNDYLFRAGTFYGDQNKFVMWGVQAYVVASGTTPWTMYSQARGATDRTRLGGFAMASTDLTGKGIEERIQILGSRMSGRGMAPAPDSYYLNPEDWQNLAISLQSRGTRALSDDSTSFGYKYLSVIAGAKEAKVFADRFFPAGHVFGLKTDSFTLYSLDDLIGKVNGDGLEMLRKSTTNDYEYRLVSYPGLGCNAPGWNGRAPL